MGHAFHLDLRHLHRRKGQSRTQTDVCAIRNSGIETTRSALTIRETRIVYVLLVPSRSFSPMRTSCPIYSICTSNSFISAVEGTRNDLQNLSRIFFSTFLSIISFISIFSIQLHPFLQLFNLQLFVKSYFFKSLRNCLSAIYLRNKIKAQFLISIKPIKILWNKVRTLILKIKEIDFNSKLVLFL